MEWIIGGKRYSEAEYAEYEKQEAERWERVQEENRRLIRRAAEAFMDVDRHMEANPRYPYGIKDDAQQREVEIFERLRQNLGAADRAPRCEKVREDGTRCGSPQMKGYRYCYAHERMLQMQTQKLDLPGQEDANGIQMAIMRVQKALIDDEISEKKAGLLLYSLQMASSNLKHTTFGREKKEVVTEMVESPRRPTSRHIAVIEHPSPGTPGDTETGDSQEKQIPFTDAAEERRGYTKPFHRDRQEGRRREITQPGAAVPHEITQPEATGAHVYGEG